MLNFNERMKSGKKYRKSFRWGIDLSLPFLCKRFSDGAFNNPIFGVRYIKHIFWYHIILTWNLIFHCLICLYTSLFVSKFSPSRVSLSSYQCLCLHELIPCVACLYKTKQEVKSYMICPITMWINEWLVFIIFSPHIWIEYVK